MKKIVIIILNLLFLVSIAACNNQDNDAIPAKTLTSSESVPINMLADFVASPPEEILIYQFDDEAIPYIDVENYFAILSRLNNQIGYVAEVDRDTLTVEHRAGFSGQEVFTYETIFNATNNEIISDSALFGRVDFFYINSMQGVNYTNYTHIKNEGFTLDLNTYHFTIEQIADRFFMPLHVVTLLFNPLHIQTSYQGDALYFGHQGSFEDPLESAFDETILPNEIMEATINYLRLFIDYMHGPSLLRNLDSDGFLEPYLEDLRDASRHYQTVQQVLYALDDLMTYPIESNLYMNDNSFTFMHDDAINGTIWETRKAMNQTINNYCDAFLDLSEAYKLVNSTTAIVTLPRLAYNNLNPQFMDYIISEDTVDTIILDLSCIDAGGNALGFTEVLSLLTTEALVLTRTHLLDDTSIQATLDPEYEFTKTFNWFIITSPLNRGYTSLLTSVAKEHDLATIVGTHLLPSSTERLMGITPSGQHFYYGSGLLFNDQATHNTRSGSTLDAVVDTHDYETLIDIILNHQA